MLKNKLQIGIEEPFIQFFLFFKQNPDCISTFSAKKDNRFCFACLLTLEIGFSNENWFLYERRLINLFNDCF